MIGVEYGFYLVPPTGAGYRRNITGLLRSFSATRVSGARGSCTLVLAPGLEPDFVVRDTRLVVERTLPGQPASLLLDTQWLLRAPELGYDGGAYEDVHAGYDLNDLAYRRRVLYKSGTSQAKKSADNLDDVLKAFARENLGSLATDTDRDWSTYLQIQADLGLAPSQAKSAAFRWLHETFQELCQAAAEDDTTPTYMTWDIVAVTEALAELRTYVGQRGRDLRASDGRPGGIRFSPENGGVRRARWRRDYRDEVTHVTAGGKGKASRRALEEKENAIRIAASPFGRIEDFVDARNADTTAELRAEARARLRAGRPTELADFTLQETTGIVFGRDFGFGDYVTVDVRGRVADVRLDPMTIRIDVTEDESGNRGWTEELDLKARVESDL